MQYQRLRYRYAVVLNAGRAALGERPERPNVFRALIGPTTWRPSADILETPTSITVLVDLAGVDHEKLRVLLYEDAAILEGERRLPRIPDVDRYHQAEISQGTFRLELAFPTPIDMEQVEAGYDRGLLQMTLRKAQAMRR